MALVPREQASRGRNARHHDFCGRADGLGPGAICAQPQARYVFVALARRIALSFAVFALGGSAKVLLVRESFITGAIGLLFITSALIGRPLMFWLVRGILQSVPAGESGKLARIREELESYADAPWFVRIMTVMTYNFGLFGIVEMVARIALALALPTERFLLIAPIARYAIAAVMIAWLYVYVIPAFRRGVRSS